MRAERTTAGTGDARIAEIADRLSAAKGSVIGTCDPVVISQPEEDAFAALIGDWDPMHNDPKWRADASGGPIVLGVHILSRLADLVADCALIRNAADGLGLITIGLDGVRFPAPFPVGATARAETSIVDVAVCDGGIVLTTAHRNDVESGAKPTMVARHVAFLANGPAIDLAECRAAGAVIPAVADLPPGEPITPAPAYGKAFFAALAARENQWLGSTPWTSVSDREAHAFALLCGQRGGDVSASAHPFAGQPIPRLQLLALRAYFSPYIGLPVLTDDSMMAYNYGVDSAQWRGAVLPGTPLRDHVQLKSVQNRAAGDYLVTTTHVLEADGNPDGVMMADCKTLYRTTA